MCKICVLCFFQTQCAISDVVYSAVCKSLSAHNKQAANDRRLIDIGEADIGEAVQRMTRCHGEKEGEGLIVSMPYAEHFLTKSFS